MSNYSEMNLSNLEKKVIKNTFLTNSNILRGRESTHSQIALNSSTNQNYSPISYCSFDSSCSNILILAFNSFKIPTVELDLTSKFEDSLLISNSLQNIITHSIPNTIIKLPPTTLVLPCLRISQSLTLQGCPGTKICINDGSIIVIPASKINLQLKISEIEFYHENPSSNFETCLFSVQNHSVTLELCDCILKSKIGLDNSEVYCFSMAASNPKDNVTMEDSKIILSSCTASNFSEICHGSQGCSFLIDRCHLSECSSSAINLNNPLLLQISCCVIEKCMKNGIEILAHTISDEASTYRTKSSTSRKVKHEIIIENTDILHNQGCGFILYSEHISESVTSIIFNNNKVSYNKKEGFAVKHATLICMKVSNNDFKLNHLSGLWLQKLHRASNNSELTIEYNRSFDSCMGYGAYIYSTSLNFNNNEIFRNSQGGIMLAGTCTSSIYDLKKISTILLCTIHHNGDNGIHISEYSNQLSIVSCRISDNGKNGLVLLTSEGRSEGNYDSRNYVEVRSCQINSNEEYGATIVHYRTHFVHNVFMENKQGILRMGENTQQLITFEDQDSVQIGNPLVPIKSNRACRGSCQLF